MRIRKPIYVRGASAVVPEGEEFNVIRDWSGGIEEIAIRQRWEAFDLAWSGASHTEEGFLAGPYDINNSVHFIDGTDHLETNDNVVLLAYSAQIWVEVGMWILADSLPSVGSDTIHNVWRIFNVDNDLYIRGDLILTSGGDVFVEGAHGDATGGGTRFEFRHTTAIDKVGWIWVSWIFDHTIGGAVDTITIDHDGTAQSGRPSGIDIPGSNYDRIEMGLGSGVGVGNLKGLKWCNPFILRDPTSAGQRTTIRGYTTQAQFDTLIAGTLLPVHYYKHSDPPLELGVTGDRFVHDISGSLHRALALGGSLDRSVASGPLDQTFSYRLTGGCVYTALGHHDIANHPMSTLFFYRENGVSNTDDWFMRFESSEGGYVQLERRFSGSTFLRFRHHPKDASGDTTMDITLSPMFDGSWHRIVWTMGANVTEWRITVDAITYMGGIGSLPVGIGTDAEFKIGNLDVNLSLVGVADYYDASAFTIYPSQATEGDVLDYHEAEAYLLSNRMQIQATGI